MPVFLLPLLGRLAGSKWTWIAAGVVIAIMAALFYIHSVHNKGVAEGEAKVEVIVQQKTIETQRKMNDAEAKGPRTKSDAISRLRAGTF